MRIKIGLGNMPSYMLEHCSALHTDSLLLLREHVCVHKAQCGLTECHV